VEFAVFLAGLARAIEVPSRVVGSDEDVGMLDWISEAPLSCHESASHILNAPALLKTHLVVPGWEIVIRWPFHGLQGVLRHKGDYVRDTTRTLLWKRMHVSVYPMYMMMIALQLTIVAEQIDEPGVCSTNAHEKNVSRFTESMVSVRSSVLSKDGQVLTLRNSPKDMLPVLG